MGRAVPARATTPKGNAHVATKELERKVLPAASDRLFLRSASADPRKKVVPAADAAAVQVVRRLRVRSERKGRRGGKHARLRNWRGDGLQSTRRNWIDALRNGGKRTSRNGISERSSGTPSGQWRRTWRGNVQRKGHAKRRKKRKPRRKKRSKSERIKRKTKNLKMMRS